MSQPEAKLSRQIMNTLRRRGAWVFKVHGNEYMMNGLPDIVGVWRGSFIAVETKMPGKMHNVSRRQTYVHDQIRRAGGVVVVACSPTQALKLILNELHARDA